MDSFIQALAIYALPVIFAITLHEAAMAMLPAILATTPLGS